MAAPMLKVATDAKVLADAVTALREELNSCLLSIQLSTENFDVQATSVVHALDRAEACSDRCDVEVRAEDIADIKRLMICVFSEFFTDKGCIVAEDVRVQIFLSFGKAKKFGDPAFVVLADLISVASQLRAYTANHSDESAAILYSKAAKVNAADGVQLLLGDASFNAFRARTQDALTSDQAAIVKTKVCREIGPAFDQLAASLVIFFPRAGLASDKDMYRGEEINKFMTSVQDVVRLAKPIGCQKEVSQLDVLLKCRDVMAASLKAASVANGSTVDMKLGIDESVRSVVSELRASLVNVRHIMDSPGYLNKVFGDSHIVPSWLVADFSKDFNGGTVEAVFAYGLVVHDAIGGLWATHLNKWLDELENGTPLWQLHKARQ